MFAWAVAVVCVAGSEVPCVSRCQRVCGMYACGAQVAVGGLQMIYALTVFLWQCVYVWYACSDACAHVILARM